MSSRASRTVLALALCLITAATFGQSCTTTITGKVFSPLGPSAGDPIPNILVYVATTPVAPFTTAGPGSCANPAGSVSGTPLVSTTTNAAGVFTLNSTGLAALGSTVNVVIQAGKWRRQNQVAITPCATTTVNLTMPANQSQGDLPHIAVVTGEADSVECIFRRIGIADSEFTDPGAGGSINLYEGSGIMASGQSGGGAVVNPQDSHIPSEADLVESPATLNNYDLVMFGCQSTANDAIPNQNTNGALNNLVNYANNGGRIFATHYGYVWLDTIQPFESSATWLAPNEPYSSANGVIVPATINPNYAQSATLSQWLQNVGASYNGVQGQVGLLNVRVDTSAVNNPPAQSWVNLNKSNLYTGTPSVQFTFDTPINTSSMPSVALTFTNTPTNFLQADSADQILINVTNFSTTTAADSSLNLSLTVPTGVTVTSLAGASAGTGWICSVGTLSCNRTTSLAAGATDSLLMGVSIAANAPLGNANIPVTISGGGLSNNLQCGRVLYNDYHVENSAAALSQYPHECASNALSAQEKFLEYSLYNLSNFVAPVTTDVIDIQAQTLLTWATPAAIYYGTPLSGTQLNATASAPGTFLYNPAAGAVLPVGTNTLNVTFTPTDPTSYTGATGSTTIQVLQDTTTSSLTSSPNPSNQGDPVTFTATVIGNAAAPTGTVSFYLGATLIGTGSLTATTGDASTATLTTSTLPIGASNITASYGGTTSFAGSQSNTVIQVVKGNSTTTINGLSSTIDYGQSVFITGTAAVLGSSSGGTITVYVDGVLACTLTAPSASLSGCPGTGFGVGTHTVTATFSGDAMYNGSTSPKYTIQVVPDPTQTAITSSLNPSYFGNSVTFTATISAPYATPTGTVTFSDGNTSLGVGTLNNNGIATYSITALAIGTHNIIANYAATTNFNASTNSVGQVVLPPLPLNGMPGFILTVTPTTLNALVGANNGILVNINEVNGYSQPITLSCSGLTNEATCGLPQTIVPAGGGTVTIYITPASPHACGSSTPYFIASSRTNGFIWMSGFAFVFFFARRRRRLLKGVALLLALCALPMLNGCGTGCTDFGTKPGTYSFTLTATPPAASAISGNPYTTPQSQTITFNATL